MGRDRYRYDRDAGSPARCEAGLCYAMLAMVTDYDVWHDVEEDVSVEVVNPNLQANREAAR